MKIGYLTKQNPEDKKAYSGTHFYMHQALQRKFDRVISLGPVDSKYKYVSKIEGKLRTLFSSKIYKYQYDIRLAKRMSSIIDKKIKQQNPDVILASLMNPEVAYLKTEKPVYLTSDATFPLLHNLYQSHSNLHPKSVEEAFLLEKRAFERATKLIFPLQWLAESAIRDYGISPDKIEVAPYGSNLEEGILGSELEEIIQIRSGSEKVKLLFVGVRWEEKGGPFAVEVLQKLQEKDVDAELWIMGCEPKVDNTLDKIHTVGFLDKSIPEEQKKLSKIYREATFFIMPTKAECIGMSFIEAASFGLPAIGTNVGGIPEAVIHQKTGYIIDSKDRPERIADWILSNWKNNKQYSNLSKHAYQRYQNLMNWDRWAESVKDILTSS